MPPTRVAIIGAALDLGAGRRGVDMIERSMIAGLNSTGVDVSDLRVLPSAVARHLLKTHDYAAGFHVGFSAADADVVAIRFYEEPGIQLSPALQKEVEKHFNRGELRRAAGDAVGGVDYPVRAREIYAEELLDTLDQDAIRERDFRIVVDYGYSAASLVLPLVLGPLGVEVVAAHAFTPSGEIGPRANLRSLIGQSKKLVNAVGANFGVVFDRAGERLYLIDESGREIPVEQALLLFLKLIGSNGRRGKLAFPVTVTGQVDRILKGSGLEVIRTPASLSELTKAAAQDGVIFAGAIGGGYVFPDFLPAYDAMIPAVAFGVGLVFGLTFDTTGPRIPRKLKPIPAAGAQPQRTTNGDGKAQEEDRRIRFGDEDAPGSQRTSEPVEPARK